MSENIFNHLLDIENSAATLILEAREEADKRISMAKSESEVNFKKEFDRIISGLERKFLLQKQKIDEHQKNEYDKFDSELKNLKKDEDHFYQFLDRYLLR